MFAAKGAGTVVTGTLTGGMMRVEDELSVLPQHAAVRVRALQSQYADRTKVGPGNRVAANSSDTTVVANTGQTAARTLGNSCHSRTRRCPTTRYCWPVPAVHHRR